MTGFTARLFATLLLAQPALAQEGKPLEMRFQLGFESEHEGNFDLDDSDREDVNAHELTFSSTLEYRLTERMRAYLEAEAVFTREYRQGETTEKTERLEINQAYLAFENLPFEGSELVLGRFLLREALLRKSRVGRGSPFPGQTYPTASVTGMPSAV